MMKSDKYDIHWQVQRVLLKEEPTIEDKLKTCYSYLSDFPYAEDVDRVANYLEGLSMAYKGDQRAQILKARDKVLKTGSKIPDSRKTSLDFKTYDRDVLSLVAKDNMTRAKNWLKKGYNHEGLTNFLRKLFIYLKDEKRLNELDSLVKNMPKENTHKFFF